MLKAPRGTFDILPEEEPFWTFIEKTASEICHLYGYGRIETPIFEDAALFLRSIGEGTDIVEKEMYIFEDRGKNRLALKPEGTAPVCRAYIEHGMFNRPQPVRLYYFSPIFRYERPQAGRYRQHHQFGVEVLGDADPALDAEVIEIAWKLLTSLGLGKIRLELNSIGCKECRPGFRERLKEFYHAREEELCPDCRQRLERSPLRLLDCKQERCRSLADAAPKSTDFLCPPCREHFESLKHYLGILEIPFNLNHRLVRGLDYYTRTVFEIIPEGGGAQSTLVGGGRYDDLIAEIGGRPTPGVGFAAGMERLVLQLKAQGISVPPLNGPRLFLAYLGERAKSEAINLAARLRREGIGILLAPQGKSLKGQLRQANSRGMPFALIIGEAELENGEYRLRDMRRGEERGVCFEELVKLLREASP